MGAGGGELAAGWFRNEAGGAISDRSDWSTGDDLADAGLLVVAELGNGRLAAALVAGLTDSAPFSTDGTGFLTGVETVGLELLSAELFFFPARNSNKHIVNGFTGRPFTWDATSLDMKFKKYYLR